MTMAFNRHINRLREDSRQYYNHELNDYQTFHLKNIRINHKDDIKNMIYYKLEEYRALNDEKENKEKLLNSFEQLLHYCYLRNSVCCMIVNMNQGYISIYYGFEVKNNMNIRERLNSCFYDHRIVNMKENLNYLYSGCICGDYSELDINNVLKTFKNINGSFMFSFKPVSIENEKQRLEGLYNQFSRAASITYDHSMAKNYHYQSHNQQTKNFIDLLENKLQYINNPKQGFVLTECFFGANNRNDLEYIGKHLAGYLSIVQDQRINHSLSVIYTDINPLNHMFTTSQCFHINRINNGFNQLLSIKDASYLMLPPTTSFKGIQVYKQYKSDNDENIFDTSIPLFDKPSQLFIGYNKYNQKYLLPKDYLQQHLFIDGKPGFGKTTLVKRLIIELDREGIKPFIIESAKKEYASLVHHIKDIKVYSAGNDGIDLKINVFAVDDGIMVSKHVSSLIGAFMSLFDGESPLPETMTRYINYLYQKHNIKMSDMGNRNMTYPTLEEFLTGIQDFVENHTSYEKKVKGNLASAIYNRVASLVEGPAGQILNCDKGMSIQSMMNHCTLIELDDIEEENRDFMTMILTLKLNEYLRNMPLSDGLKHVLVLEEAHNILTNTENNNLKASKVQASLTYSRLLSEIRAYGIGIIISDQRPSQISSDVIGQSRSKITFNIDELKDIEALTVPFNLSPYQQSQLRLLKIGECLISIAGYKEIVKVKVEPLKKAKNNHYGCLFCNKKCSYKSVNINEYEKEYILKRLEYLNGKEFVRFVDQLVRQYQINDPNCFLGQTLRQTQLSDILQRRKLYMYKGGTING